MNMYKEIDQETMELLLDALLKRTLEGKQIWENLYYNPIGFVQLDAYEDKGAYISQMFETTTSFNGIEYELELCEAIDLPSCKGNIFGSISYEAEEEINKYDFSLSFDSEHYDDADAAELKNIYKDSVIVQLADAIVGVFEDSEAIADGFSYARYFSQKEINSKWKKDSLVKLGEKLMKEKAMQDFHKIVLDTDYRSSLLRK